MHELVDALERTLQSQRRPRGWRWAVGLGGMAIVAVTAGALSWGVAGGEGGICRRTGDPFEAVWNEREREQVSATLVAREVPFANAADRRFAAAVDAYVELWSASRLEACRQTQVAHVHDEAWFDAAMVCLDRRRADVDALLERIAEAPAEAEGEQKTDKS